MPGHDSSSRPAATTTITSSARSTPISTGCFRGPAGAARQLWSTATRRRSSSSPGICPESWCSAATHADAPATYRQAGELLALFHAQAAVTDDGYERRENEKSLAWLGGPHRIAASTAERLRARDRHVADAARDPRAHPRGLAAPELAHPRRPRQRHRLRPCGYASRMDRLRPAGRPGIPPRPGPGGSLPRRVRDRPARAGAGTAPGSGRRSAPPPGPARWATSRSRPRAIA